VSFSCHWTLWLQPSGMWYRAVWYLSAWPHIPEGCTLQFQIITLFIGSVYWCKMSCAMKCLKFTGVLFTAVGWLKNKDNLTSSNPSLLFHNIRPWKYSKVQYVLKCYSFYPHTEISGSSEIFVTVCHTTWSHIPEVCNVHSNRHESLRAHDMYSRFRALNNSSFKHCTSCQAQELVSSFEAHHCILLSAIPG
jgi:hypothetical protein